MDLYKLEKVVFAEMPTADHRDRYLSGYFHSVSVKLKVTQRERVLTSLLRCLHLIWNRKILRNAGKYFLVTDNSLSLLLFMEKETLPLRQISAG